MNIWVITWRWSDGSGSGALPTAYADKALAQRTFELLQQEGMKVYELVQLDLLETVTRPPAPVPVAPGSQLGQYWWSKRIGGLPHAGVQGVTPFDQGVLTVRTLNALRAEGIETLEQLVCWKDQWLLMLPNLGRKSLNELKEYLDSKGLKLKGEDK